MTVYLVADRDPYEGCYRHYVFSTEETAKEFMATHKPSAAAFILDAIEVDSHEGVTAF